MERFHQLLFVVSILALSWLVMLAVHELGHVMGAIVTGGLVDRVVLHPLAISRTDVSPNPHPGMVVWLGPIVGCVLPLALLAIVRRRINVLRNIVRFFAGFCLIANGLYISIGSFSEVGDCGEMLRTGTPLWVMLCFGAITVPLGFLLWNALGSPWDFFNNPSAISPRTAYFAFGVLLLVFAVELALFSQ